MGSLLNRTRVNTATTGTGTITLGSAVTGFASFAEAGAVNARQYSYCIEDGNDFELGLGTYTSSGSTFSRDTVTMSKIGGTIGTSKINLTGFAKIFLTPLADDLNVNLSLGFVFDGSGGVLATGSYPPGLYVPFSCRIVGWTILGDVSGSVVFDLWKDTYANYPPTVADTITASAKPTVSGAVKATSTTLTGWTTVISAGDIIIPNIDSVATMTKAELVLQVIRT